MATKIIPLVELFVEIVDFRQASGKRYALSAILALACVAMLCGYRSYSAMAEWGRNYDPALVQALDFTRGQTPCAGALYWIFRHLDREQFEAKLRSWAESVLAAYPARADTAEGISIDGTTVKNGMNCLQIIGIGCPLIISGDVRCRGRSTFQG